MHRPYIQSIILLFVIITNSCTVECQAEDLQLVKVEVQETSGLKRNLEYVVCSLQIPIEDVENIDINIEAVDKKSNERILCQIFNRHVFPEEKIGLLDVIFPVSIDPNERKIYILQKTNQKNNTLSDLSYQGKGTELIIENEFYRADLTKTDQSEAKSHSSGQLRELFLKMGLNILLFRSENRMHWAPNFQNRDHANYKTISAWDNPENFSLDTGPYLIHTIRRDQAPEHPEILLTANYYFYSGLPFIKFNSSMEVTKNVWLFLLRNDEMTMDSLFTHVAFQRPTGHIEDLSFSERYKILEDNPIENNAPWLCFYHEEKGYAFGSIRLLYDIKNAVGNDSPTYLPHTKISDGAEGGKYWNRRLIHESPLFVPEGSRYREQNAYIVFKMGAEEKFGNIQKWTQTLKNPLQVLIN
jgi:hypothetical protein